MGEIQVFDWKRMLAGEVPAEFYIEVVIRLLFIFILALVTLRFMGKRMAGRLSRSELAALVSLAAAIGIPIQAPDKGLLPAVMIALVILLLERIISFFAYRSEKFEYYTLGNVSILVDHAVMNLDIMRKNKLSRERIFAQLRSQGIRHLGEVKRLYIEANGTFSLIKEEKPEPGLIVTPDWDKEFMQEHNTVPQQVCCNCGAKKQTDAADESCINCDETTWTQAVTLQ